MSQNSVSLYCPVESSQILGTLSWWLVIFFTKKEGHWDRHKRQLLIWKIGFRRIVASQIAELSNKSRHLDRLLIIIANYFSSNMCGISRFWSLIFVLCVYRFVPSLFDNKNGKNSNWRFKKEVLTVQFEPLQDLILHVFLRLASNTSLTSKKWLSRTKREEFAA